MSAYTVADAWDTFYQQAPLERPTSEGEYIELKELADYLLDTRNIEEGKYAALFDIVTGYMDHYERQHEPELKEASAPPKDVLAHYMEARGVSQYQLAKAGVATQGTLSAMLSGKRGISLDVAKKLGKFFGVAPSLFLDL